MADEHVETGLIGGDEKVQIRIVDYDTEWPKKFEAHARVIADALGRAAQQIEHVGSTSVPGLAAKPIIDILVVVQNSADESAYMSRLEAAGYILRVREPDWNEHRMFRTHEKDVHVHIYSVGCAEIQRVLTFRDRLRINIDDRRRYEQDKARIGREGVAKHGRIRQSQDGSDRKHHYPL